MQGPAFIPSFLPPSGDFSGREIRLALSEADQEVARLDGIAHQIEHPELLFSHYLKREAVLSSAIEGTHTTLADLVLFEASQKQSGPDDVHVSNYVSALSYGRERIADLPLGRRLFAELHQILMAATEQRQTTPGRLRDCVVYIGSPPFPSARFVPPPPEFVPELVDDLERYVATADEPVLVKLAVAHYQFETIHPFRDGNGRLGRLMILLWLERQRILTAPMLYLSAYFERHKEQYYDALLRVSTHGAWEDWILFFLRGVATQSRDASRRTRELSTLRSEYKSRLTGPRTAEGLHRLVDDLFGIAAISVPGARRILGVSYPAAAASVKRLVAAGILNPEPYVVRGTGYYVAGELLRKIQEPFEEVQPRSIDHG
jgi:Fic family protein